MGKNASWWDMWHVLSVLPRPCGEQWQHSWWDEETAGEKSLLTSCQRQQEKGTRKLQLVEPCQDTNLDGRTR